MSWQRMYAMGYIASYENKERNEIILVGNINNKIKVTKNHQVLGEFDSQPEAKEIVMAYIKENP